MNKLAESASVYCESLYDDEEMRVLSLKQIPTNTLNDLITKIICYPPLANLPLSLSLVCWLRLFVLLLLLATTRQRAKQ